jgi:signal transduction histidine kinase
VTIVPPLAAVAHELRTPLHGILGCADLLAATALDADQRAHLGALTEAARALAAFAEDALALAQLAAADADGAAVPAVVAVRPVPCDARAVLAGVARTLAPLAAARGLALDAAVDADVPALVRIDPARVREVLLNLAGNAVRATRRGSVRLRARVTAAPAGAAAGPADPWLALDVADTGPGLSAERQAALFRPWTPGAGGEGDARPGGAGIGLVLAAALAARMGGTLGVASAPGVGSTFTLRLPLPAA